MSSPDGGKKKASKASTRPPEGQNLGGDSSDGFQSARSKKKGSKVKKKERGENRQENQQEEEERGTPPNLENVGGASQNSFSALADPEEQGGDPAASDDEEEEEGAISSSSSSLHADILAGRAKAEPATVHTLLAPGSLLEKVLANAVQKAIENDREPPAWVMQLLTGAPVSNPEVTQVLQHKLALIRRQEGTAKDFRTLFREITFYLGYEATATLTTKPICVKTDRTDHVPARKISQTVAVVPILRGGLGMTEALLELLPDSPVYHVGMYRNPGSNIPVQYYNRLPKGHPSDVALILDPIIASSRTINAVVSIVKKWGAKTIKVVTLVASRSGLEALCKMHPEVQVHLASIDELAANGLDLVPGIGDAGDRLFLGTNSMEIASLPDDKAPQQSAKKLKKSS